MQRLHVPIKGAPYTITINTWDDKHLAATLSTHLKDDRLFIITNPKLKRLYAKRLEKALPKGIAPQHDAQGDEPSEQPIHQ